VCGQDPKSTQQDPPLKSTDPASEASTSEPIPPSKPDSRDKSSESVTEAQTYDPKIIGESQPSKIISDQATVPEQAFIDRIKRSDRWMIALTGIIAVGGLLSAVIFGYQLREMQTASGLTRRSIEISESALKSSREALIVAQRPWVSIQMSLAGPLQFDDSGARIAVGIRLKNHGQTPAVNTRSFVVLDPNSAGKKGPNFCKDQRGRNLTNFAQVMFPGDIINEDREAQADGEEISRAMGRSGTIAPLLTACVDYISEIDGIRHQTESTANIFRTPKTPDGSFSIKPTEGDVPQAALSLEIIFGAQKAD
jgi:hypothetical protein